GHRVPADHAAFAVGDDSGRVTVLHVNADAHDRVVDDVAHRFDRGVGGTGEAARVRDHVALHDVVDVALDPDPAQPAAFDAVVRHAMPGAVVQDDAIAEAADVAVAHGHVDP